MPSSRTVTLVGGGSITLSLDGSLLALLRDERAFVCALLDRIDEYADARPPVARAPSLLDSHLGPAIASLLDRPTPQAIMLAPEHDCDDMDCQRCHHASAYAEPISNIDTKANIDCDLKPDAMHPPVAPMLDVQRDSKPDDVPIGYTPAYTASTKCRVCGELGHDGRRHKNDPKPVAVATVSAEPVKVPVVVPLATPEELRAQALHSHDDVLAKQLVRARNIKEQAEQRRAELERPRVLHARPAGQRPPSPVDRAAAEAKLPTPRATFTVENGVVR